MHIAFLTSEYPHSKLSKSAGLGSSIANLARELVHMNHKVTVFVFGQGSDDEFEDNEIRIQKIKHRSYTFGGWYKYRKHLQKIINRKIEEVGIDLLEAPDWGGITAFMNIQCPLVIRLHGSDTYFCHLENRTQKRKNYFFEKKALKNADHIVSVSHFTAKKTSELFHLNRDIKIIHNGVKLPDLNEEIEVDDHRILYFGSIIRKKGVLELGSIFNHVVEKIPNATLEILGKDVIDNQTQQSTLALMYDVMSEAAILNTVHIPEVPYAQVAHHLQKAAVIALPSFAEAFPMTWLEGMAYGKGMVTSDIGWASEIMNNGVTGFTVDPRNHELFADRIVQLLNDSNHRETLGKNARNKIEKEFSIAKIAGDNQSFYNTIVKK